MVAAVVLVAAMCAHAAGAWSGPLRQDEAHQAVISAAIAADRAVHVLQLLGLRDDEVGKLARVALRRLHEDTTWPSSSIPRNQSPEESRPR